MRGAYVTRWEIPEEGNFQTFVHELCPAYTGSEAGAGADIAVSPLVALNGRSNLCIA